MENKDRRNLYYKLLISIAVLIPVLMGISYAFFFANIRGEATNIEATAVNNFDLNLVTENGGYISATNIVPIPDSDIDAYASVGTFKVVAGDNAYPINYSISLTDITITNGLKNADFKWKLLRNNIELATGSFENYTSGDLTLKTDFLIEPNTIDDYKILIWIKETTADQSGVLNQSFKGKVKITGEFIITDFQKNYQQVEYIASSGKQYIDTGVSINGDYTLYGDGYIPDGESGSFIDGFASTSIRTGFLINNTSSYRYAYYWFGVNNTFVNLNSEDIDLKSRFQTTQNKNGITFTQNGSVVASSTYNGTSGTNSATINLLRQVQNSYAKHTVLYNAKIFDGNGTEIHNYVPCYRKNDGVIGVYDLVDGLFYTNAGEGTFNKGSNVN